MLSGLRQHHANLGIYWCSYRFKLALPSETLKCNLRYFITRTKIYSLEVTTMAEQPSLVV